MAYSINTNTRIYSNLIAAIIHNDGITGITPEINLMVGCVRFIDAWADLWDE
jgi:hypothetical protein